MDQLERLLLTRADIGQTRACSRAHQVPLFSHADDAISFLVGGKDSCGRTTLVPTTVPSPVSARTRKNRRKLVNASAFA
jgi:hypothetical protein